MDELFESANLYLHRVNVFDVGERRPFFLELLKNKKVLHIGCTDWPVPANERGLHFVLSQHIDELHGLDIDVEGIEDMRKHIDKKFYSRYEDIDESYDVLLVPEVLEHTLNPGLFLKQLFEIDCNEIVLTAPNAIGHIQSNPKFGWKETAAGPAYLESVHIHHNCYYSPMTLIGLVNRSIEAYTDGRWQILLVFLTQESTQVGCVIGKKPVAGTDETRQPTTQ